MSLFGGKDVDAGGASGATFENRIATPVAREADGEDSNSIGGKMMANIGKSISIKGDLTGNEDLVIEGKVEGKVDLPSNQVTIGANGTVAAEVNAKSVVVVGRVSGDVNGTERVEIQATGVVEGDVASPRLVVAEGAVLNGAITMTKKQGAAASPSPRPTVAPQRDGIQSGEIRKAV